MNFRRRVTASLLRQMLLWGVFVGFCGNTFAASCAALLHEDGQPTALAVAALDQPALPSESIGRVGFDASKPAQPTATAHIDADRVGNCVAKRCVRAIGPSAAPLPWNSLVACGVRLQI
ncbi:hypothetical protein Mal15_30290 [Stieleria maiorica]|uniref:Uncharacterized protein n=1 Tax=Stieleria maiorica TaxID=2795974 RepID=A0A5B9MCC6_9BACT|nr:hypothetical protein [Stieleria maiorica]QEF98971.1 hypothetical protein Mal15_30290 [Stieleria maiorica]